MVESMRASANLIPDLEIPKSLFWEGNLFDYLDRVMTHPRTVCTADERVYSMITHYGKHTYTVPWSREPIVHYNLFDDPFSEDHKHAIYGIDQRLMDFVGVIHAASCEFGQQDRIILLEGPVGTAKSTLGELLADGLEDYTTTDEGAYYATYWVVGEDSDGVVNKDQGSEILGTIRASAPPRLMISKDTEGIVIKEERGEVSRDDAVNPYRFECQMHEQPLRMIPKHPVNIRRELLKNLNQYLENRYQGMSKNSLRDYLKVPEGEEVFPHYPQVRSKACPRCSDIFWKFFELYKGNWKKVLENHLRVKRVFMSRDRRIGIAITRPKSEKDQDATEWSGEPNYVALSKFGSPLDSRTFEFRGYFEIAEGGILYSEELLKLATTFLYDYLGASQEHRIQPKGFVEVDIDVRIIGGTNEEEYEKLKQTKEMAAIRDRIVKVTIPYIDDFSKETKIYRKFFHEGTRYGRHLAPFTIDIASFWAVATRLKPSNRISIRNKVKLYAGKHVEGFTEDTIRELKKEAERECRDGASPRYINDRISEGFMKTFISRGPVDTMEKDCVTPFGVMREIRNGLAEHPHLSEKSKREEWDKLVSEAEAELNSWLTDMIQEIIVGDKEALEELHAKYIDNLMALRDNRKIFDETRGEVEPDKSFLEAIEAEAKKTDSSSRDQFRTKIINAIARRATELTRDRTAKPFTYDSDEVLLQAYKDFLFKQEQKNIDWQALISKKVVGEQASRRLAAIKEGLEKRGCCPTCSSVFITHVAGIFSRGQNK